ncbi:MAG: CHAD domain-containing protein, partial [Burkholderiaceae bacterium]
SLGAARDHDVFRTTLLPGLAALLPPRDAVRLQAWARREGATATTVARNSLASRDYSEHLLAFARELLSLKLDEPTSPAYRLTPWASKRLRQRHRKLLQQIRKADLFDPIERHQVRIEAKKLRYALDFLASLWPPEQMAPCSEALAQAQDLLGAMNDLVTAQRLLATAPRTGTDRLQAVLDARLVESAAHLPAMLKALKQAPVPWK